jgi:hypothetical protein
MHGIGDHDDEKSLQDHRVVGQIDGGQCLIVVLSRVGVGSAGVRP